VEEGRGGVGEEGGGVEEGQAMWGRREAVRGVEEGGGAGRRRRCEGGEGGVGDGVGEGGAEEAYGKQ